eukprot:scaffold241487_cov14-Tisochrysis_lutea.AAC.1
MDWRTENPWMICAEPGRMHCLEVLFREAQDLQLHKDQGQENRMCFQSTHFPESCPLRRVAGPNSLESYLRHDASQDV